METPINNNNNNQKKKSYYSLNLSEGRIFLIFISLIVVVALLIFGGVFLFSGKKSDTSKVTVEKVEDKNASDFTYYSELKPDIEKNNSSSSSATGEKSDYTLAMKDKKEVQPENKETPENTNKDQVKLDNSKVLYSSNYTNGNAKTENKKEVKKSEKAPVKEQPKKETKKGTEEKFVVQVGSYTNKKTADDISLFYKMQGFPAYIIEKKESDKTFYRLRVGPFAEKTKAEENLLNIKKSKYGENSFISKVYL